MAEYYETLDQVASRLEELSVDLDCEELQGLANTLSTLGSAPCEACKKRSHKEGLLDMFIRELIKYEVVTPESIYGHRGMYPPGPKNAVNIPPHHVIDFYRSTVVDPNKAFLNFDVV